MQRLSQVGRPALRRYGRWFRLESKAGWILMGSSDPHVVTGASGYTGRHITRGLLAKGHVVRTVDTHAKLAESLQGASVLYNTYWIRVARGDVSFETAVSNTGNLLRACEQAGVRRLVHISISNPSDESPLPYYRGKAIVERMFRGTRLSYAILRPTVLFGAGDILINNIAWLLRRFPIFAMPACRRSRL